MDYLPNTKKIHVVLIMALHAWLFSGCSTDEVNCPGFDSANTMLNYVQVTENVAAVTYRNQDDTLIFNKDVFEFSSSYVEKCGDFSDPSCNCTSVFEATYRAGSIFLTNDVIVRGNEEEATATVDINYQSNGFRWTSDRIENTPTAINNYFQQLEIPQLELNGTTYLNIIELTNMSGTEAAITKMYIQKNNGLIGFILDEKTYTLVEN